MRLHQFLLATTILILGFPLHAAQRTETARLPDIDNRLRAVGVRALEAHREAGVKEMKRRISGCEVHIDPLLQTPKFVYRKGRSGFLTKPDPAIAAPQPQAVPPQIVPRGLRLNPAAIVRERPVKNFLAQHAAAFGHGPEVLNSASIKRDYITAHNGMRTVVWEQQLDGIPVFGSVLIEHVTRRGELVCLSSQFLPEPERASGLEPAGRAALRSRPPIQARQAVANAAVNVGEDLKGEGVAPLGEAGEGAERRQLFRANPLSGNAGARLVWLPLHRNAMRLCWEVTLMSRTRGAGFQVLIDAQTGDPLMRRCLTSNISDVSYRVFTSDSPSPFSPGWPSPSSGQPALTSRSLVTLSALSTTASPNGWINDGMNTTVGNNVDAHLDPLERNPIYDDPLLDPPRPVGILINGIRTFDFPLDLTSAPSTYTSAAVVQLFYWCNWMLDRLYELGFTEAAGNFQQDNFGRGGLGGDAVVADAQDKSGLDPSFLTRNNADFTPFPDGDPSQQPRMQMFVWDGPDPQRDGALDAEVILHEYTHGLSYRLVGGGNALSFGGQSGAMGEGWSDFFALSLLSQPGEDPAATYALGAYPTLEPFYLPSYDQNYYFGLRRYPNSTDMGKNPLTFKDIDPAQASQHMGVPLNPLAIAFPGIPADEVHNAGEVWCVALWEMRAKLIAKLGPTIGEAQANERALQLVVDGMKLTPPFPNFVQARDAILLAEQIRSAQTQDPNDSDLEDLWEAFAKRGLGSGAAVHHLWSVDGLNEYFPVQEDFSVPPPGWEFSITGSSSAPAVGPDGTVYVGSTDGHVYAVDREGNLMWRFPDQDPGLQPFKSTPAISSGGTIYIGCDDHKLYALNPDGTLKWDFETQGAVVSSPAVGRDGAIYFGSMDGGFHALEPDGSPLRAPIQLAPIQSSPAIGQFIPAGSPVQIIVGVSGVSGGLRAFREDNGSSLWAATAIGEVLTSPAIGPFHSVYVGAGNQLHSIAQDGAIQWSMPLDSPVVGSPVIGPHNNPGNGQWVVYVGTTGAKVWAIRVSSTSHSLLWSVQLPSLRAGIALDGNGVVFAGGDEAVYAMANGQLSFTMPLPGENVTSAPGIGPDGTLYFTTNQKLHALRQLASPPGLVWPMFHRDARRLGNSTVITLTAKGLTSDGRFRFTLENPMPFPVVLEASEDLVQWEELTSIGALLTFDLVDPDTGTHARRFFRARVP